LTRQNSRGDSIHPYQPFDFEHQLMSEVFRPDFHLIADIFAESDFEDPLIQFVRLMPEPNIS